MRQRRTAGCCLKAMRWKPELWAANSGEPTADDWARNKPVTISYEIFTCPRTAYSAPLPGHAYDVLEQTISGLLTVPWLI